MTEEVINDDAMTSQEGIKPDLINVGTPSQTFSYTHAIEASKDYFNGEELPASVFVQKYALKDLEGRYYENTPDQMHMRLAKEFGRMERKFMGSKLNGNDPSKLSEYGKTRQILSVQRIYELFKDFKYVVPQGSVMSMLGNPYQIGSLSNCFVLPELHDSYGGILYADQQLIQLAKRRGGIGIDISNLRPDNMAVSNAAGSSTGAVSFMERFSSSCREVAQKGRRGALMLSIDIQHPDVEKFITIKQDLTKVTGANISVKVSDEFMKAVKDDKEYTHQWPVGSAKPSITKTIKARELWNTLVTQARNNAEPGILFWDRLHWYSTSSVYPQYKNISTNPCISGDALIEACEEDYQSYKVKIPMKELVGRIISGENISVLTYNEKTKETEYKDVEAGMLTKKDANIIELELEDGRTLKLTPEHKVFTENRGWIEASLLTEDDILLEI